MQLPPAWRGLLSAQTESEYYRKLTEYVAAERSAYTIFPPPDKVFEALRLTGPDETRVVIVGQDPYHGKDQAHGLCFSVPEGAKRPPSLVNIFKELESDLECKAPPGGDLSMWARQGVLLLNSVLTVRAHEPGSHSRQGWERFTDAVISLVTERNKNCVYILWGAYAQNKLPRINAAGDLVIRSAHPSPLSARNGFFGSRPFSRTNAALEVRGLPAIEWRLIPESPTE